MPVPMTPAPTITSRSPSGSVPTRPPQLYRHRRYVKGAGENRRAAPRPPRRTPRDPASTTPPPGRPACPANPVPGCSARCARSAARAAGCPGPCSRCCASSRRRYALIALSVFLAARQAMAPELHAFNEWLAEVLQDERLQPPGRFQVLLYQHVRALLTGRTESAEIQPDDDMTVLALRYWMISARTARPPDLDEHHAFQQRVVSEALRTEP